MIIIPKNQNDLNAVIMLPSRHVVITVVLKRQHVTIYSELFMSSDWELWYQRLKVEHERFLQVEIS